MTLSLLADGALRLDFPPSLASALHRWLPLLPSGDPGPPPPGAAFIHLSADPADDDAWTSSGAPPTLRLGAVAAHVRDDAGDVALRGASGAVRGRIALGERVALLSCPDGGARPEVAADELYSALTVASALLLGRLGRALAHAAAVVAPDGGAWLLVGDTHAGKTTTTVNLLGAGWGYVSDDHVVLSRGGGEGGGIGVEGWPRRFHLDQGWEAGTPGQPRAEVDPRERWPGRWRRTAPLAGLLFPRVEAEEPTRLVRGEGGGALAALLRQSPWLLADRGAAPGVLALLREAAERPAYELRLGLDTYRDPARLVGVLGEAVG